jgi:hypothetical protein
MILLRWRWRRQGTRVQVRVFTGEVPTVAHEPPVNQWTFCGHLTFRVIDWPDVVALLGPRIDLREDEAM